ncbi:hypothetical protein MPSEU_000226100 [Mayamaea pseudoterrestris]|nr:hypothetical protein MPSEU_000226100 [Mayamaea pseudoterrestris]
MRMAKRIKRHKQGHCRSFFSLSIIFMLLSCSRALRSVQFSVQRQRQLHHRFNMASHSSTSSTIEGGSVVKQCRLIALVDPNDPANAPLLDNADKIPDLQLLAAGSSLDDFRLDSLQDANAIFVSSSNAREPLAQLLQAIPSIEWIHTRSAGIDHVVSKTLSDIFTSKQGRLSMTNARGLFSSTLAEYTLMACSYYAKSVPRILKQQRQQQWTKFPIRELRGSTMGVIGCGSIGMACARLAVAYGMRVVGLKRRRRRSESDTSNDKDEFIDKVHYMDEDSDGVNKIFAASDFIVCAAPLTEQTRHMIGASAFAHAKPHAVFVNVGRGQVVDEDALVEALESGQLRGAGLDVVATEPLPKESRLWNMDNVLLSPHNMDMTETFMHESTEWFVSQNLPRFVRGLELENKVDPTAGY